MADTATTATPEAPETALERTSTGTPATQAAKGLDVTKLNAKIRKRQQMWLGGIAAVVLLAGAGYVMSGPTADTKDKAGKPQTIETGGLVNRDLAQREFVAMYDNRLQDLLRQQQALGLQVSATGDVAKQLEALKTENQQIRANGQAAIDAISAENEALRREITTAKTQPVPAPPIGYPQAGAPRPGPGALGGTVPDPAGLDRSPEIKTMSFGSDKATSAGGARVQPARQCRQFDGQFPLRRRRGRQR